MSNREVCASILDSLDEAFCQKLYQNYLDDPDPEKDDEMSLEDFAKSLGISVS